MKTELEHSDIQAIAAEVAKVLKPLFKSNGNAGDTADILDVEELASYLKVRREWIYQKVHEGEIPHYKVGRYPRFRRSKVDEWLKEREKGIAPQTF